ncbi:MAG: hypothetical protein M5R36_03540 [Deltaproteobacteria bacterium]|nr:hypothetical protein [Deltaproteobacteria bacterium]
MIGSAALLAAGWLAHAFAAIATVRAVGVTPTAGLAPHASLFRAGLVGRFSLVLTPGGLGVREGVLAVVLAPMYPSGIAIAVALVARLAWMAAEGVMAAVFFPFRPKAEAGA